MGPAAIRAAGPRPKRARAAGLALSAAAEDEAPGVLLLRGLRGLFDQAETDRLHTEALVDALNAMDE